MLEAILAIILSLPAPWSPPGARRGEEAPEQYRARMRTVARSIELETRPELLDGREQADLAAFVTVAFYQESGFSLDVHEGRRKGGGGLASCLGQIHVRSLIPRDEWQQLTGSDLAGTRRCTNATVRLFKHHIGRCVRRPGALTRAEAARVFEGYGSGSRCAPGKRSLARSRMWFRVRNKLRAEMNTTSQ